MSDVGTVHLLIGGAHCTDTFGWPGRSGSPHPQPVGQARCSGHRPLDGIADGRLAAHPRHLPLRPRDGRVEQLTREEVEIALLYDFQNEGYAEAQSYLPEMENYHTGPENYLRLVRQARQSLTVPVKVAQATVQPPISFRLDVMPVFMRGGCNTGSCHGAARGKDGFRLSLFGFDPQGDYFRITREMTTRRINLASPSDSLMVEKSIGSVPHTGGKRFERSSEYYKTILDWLKNGAPLDATEVPKVVRLELFPPAAVLEGAGATQQMVARAVYADGTDRDVTSLAVFLTNNDNSAPINADGLVTAAARGEAFVMGAHVQPLNTASTHVVAEPTRTRKLLLNQRELAHLLGAVERKGYTIVPLEMYWKNGRAKLQIGLAKGKKQHDKRASEKDRDWQRDKARLMRR